MGSTLALPRDTETEALYRKTVSHNIDSKDEQTQTYSKSPYDMDDLDALKHNLPKNTRNESCSTQATSTPNISETTDQDEIQQKDRNMNNNIFAFAQTLLGDLLI